MVMLDNASEIGILFSIDDIEIYNRVRKYVKYLQERGKAVKVLGFSNEKSVPHFCHPKLSYDYFSLRGLNWYGRPTGQFVEDFISFEFDLIINLDINDAAPLRYISGLSRAHLKVGVFKENNARFYDLMIRLQDEDTLPDYIKLVNHYLSILNPTPKLQKETVVRTPQTLFPGV